MGNGLKFDGKRVNIVQIGLGTFGTFVQNLAGKNGERDGMVAWLLRVLSETQRHMLSGVAVEPVPEHLQRLCVPARNLPKVAMMQVAVGETQGKAEIYVLTSEAHQLLLNGVAENQQSALKTELLYARNMSCVGGPHSFLGSLNAKLESKYGVTVPMQPIDISVWTYSQLAEHLDFCGCEVLLVDAEGYDTAILRSVIEHCMAKEEQGKDAWPEVIQFESMGHCDKREGEGAETEIISRLKRSGYELIYWTYHNTVLVRNSVASCQRIANWLRTLVCRQCKQRGLEADLPFATPVHNNFIFCWDCYAKNKRSAWKKV